MISFETLCYVKKEHITKLKYRAIKDRFLDYETSNQYVIWDIKKRRTFRAAHVDFDEVFSSSEIKRESDDFEYLTLDFMRSKQSTDDESSVKEDISINERSEIEVKIKSIEFDEKSEESEIKVDDITASNISNLSQSEIESENENSIISRIIQSFVIATFNRSSRNVVRSESYVKLNDSRYKSRDERNKRDEKTNSVFENSTQAEKAKDFAIKICKIKIKSIKIEYRLSETFKEILTYSNKEHFL